MKRRMACSAGPKEAGTEPMIEKQLIFPIVLSGGSGTRLWPASSGTSPKQFQALVGDVSMFRQTIDSVADRERFAAPIVICSPSHDDQVTKDLTEANITDERIIVEQADHNTA